MTVTLRVLVAAVVGFAGAFLGYVAAGDARQELGPRQRASTTAYSPCDGSGSLMADGTRAYYGAAASNRHPLGTLLRLERRIDPPGLRPKRYLRVRDRIGWGSELDVYMPPCGAMQWFGRRSLTYRVVVR